MTETRQAEILARWLDSSEREAPPADLAPEIVEAVLALSPGRAPPPALSVMDLLDAVQEGPLAAPDALPDPLELSAAARFAELLEDGPNEDDDPGLEALFALRPDMAPPARVTAFDLLDGLRAGPLADPILNEAMPTLPPGTGELPEALEAANTVPPEAGVKPPRRRFWVWLWPGPMALAAAAVTLFLVLPASRDLPRGFPAPESPLAVSAPPEPTVIADLPELGRRGVEDEALPGAGGGGDAPKARAEAHIPDAQASAGPPPPAEGWAGTSSAEPVTALDDGEVAQRERTPNGDAYDWLPIAEEAEPDKASSTELAEAPVAPVAGASSPSAVGGVDVGVVASSTSAAAGRRSASTRAPSARPSASAPAAPAQEAVQGFAGPSGAAIAELGATSKEQAASADASDEALDDRRRGEGLRDAFERRQDRDEAAPADGESPDRHQLARANRALALGDMATAEARLRPLLVSADHEVVVEASLRLCRIYLAQARIDEARATVRIGLAAGPEPARLYGELQQISAQLGP